MSRHELRATAEDSHDAAHGAPEVIAFFMRWAPRSTVLELGASGGRVVLPLAAAGYEVSVVDASESAIRRFLMHPGAERVHLLHADLRRNVLEQLFGVVILGPDIFAGCRTLRAQIDLLGVAVDHMTPDGVVIVETMPSAGRNFLSPAELDLMAQSAGLALRYRSSDFDGAPFDARNGKAVSVYRRRERSGRPV